MKTNLLLLIFTLSMSSVIAQEKSRKVLKAEKKLETQQLIDSLMNEKEFIFEARTANPQGGRSVNLSTTTNFIKFKPEWIESDMPFYGRAYSGVGYGGDTGLKFEGKPSEFTITKTKKNYQIESKVKGATDTYHLFLTVGFEGNASLSVNSTNRSGISYSGEISAHLKNTSEN
jgi:hypothetical protein